MRRKEWSRKGLLLYLTAVVLAGCSGDDGGQVRLEDMRKSLETSGAGGVDGQTEDGDAGQQSAEGPGSIGQEGMESPGAGQEASEDTDDTKEHDAGTPGGDTKKADGAQNGRLEDLAKEPDSDREARCRAYISVLEDIYFNQKFPGDQDFGYQPGEDYDITDNSFAVFDIDFDGKDELIVCYTTTYMGGMGEIIYDYDSATGSVREEARLFPALIYYENGIIDEQASHNHGMAGDMSTDGAFWPYSLYRYDPEQDAYTLLASVDAWSRGYREEDYDGNPFPADVDADGDGLVYYVMTGGSYELKDPMDGAEYQQWRDSCLEGAGTVQVPYESLTTDNIYEIFNF